VASRHPLQYRRPCEEPLQIRILPSSAELAHAAADRAAAALQEAIARSGRARAVVATGASQVEFLGALVRSSVVEWSRVVFFHLDEYVGLPETHPASFRHYLKTRLADRVQPGAFHFIAGDAVDPLAECRRLGALLSEAPVDVAFVGIGENGHLAFNDPPADLETSEPYLLVTLDDACRRQQVGEGWFPSLDAVPRRAISMSIRQLLRAGEIVCVVLGARKARAVQECLEGDVSPMHPASALQTHSRATVFLDPAAASLLRLRSSRGRETPRTPEGAVRRRP